MLKNLIQPFEVMQHVSGLADMSVSLCTIAPVIELSFFDCLSPELHSAMLADLVDTTNIEAFNDTIIYEIGDKVRLGACFYESLIDSNVETPTTQGAWEKIGKFNQDCFNEFWEYLAPYLSYRIVLNSLIIGSYRFGANGVTKQTGDTRGFATATEEEIKSVKESWQQIVKMVETPMLRVAKNSDCISAYLPQNECGDVCDPKIRTQTVRVGTRNGWEQLN